MRHIFILALLVVSAITNAQTNFEKGMQKAFELWQNDKWSEAENLFERIANAEPDEWLPHYYIAQMNSLKSWSVKDETVLKAQLSKAQEHLNIAKRISENNPEILIMQGQIYTNWVAFDGATYGMKYAAIISELYKKANKLAPNNPRAAFCKADWAMGSAKYFGQDTKPFCKDIEASIELFTNFKPESNLHPNWGIERAEEVLASCKS
ncbi:hypothetical protein RM697_10890 [Ichthyenterobacterium sp. W332]|uniref:Tetratricopeptide repeat protein n=1 Tax=Microcosmobacter mediterraneus TaxID=3075607 RepID=A0ABU2YLX2_9FLAO|nr:hypothetical protein [Ichthyenterobacterium sp. W332]MDT0559159.1 hypothetical protein [Ichthyenterobacterium sp. W332]